jgi:hypothetical protein
MRAYRILISVVNVEIEHADASNLLERRAKLRLEDNDKCDKSELLEISENEAERRKLCGVNQKHKREEKHHADDKLDRPSLFCKAIDEEKRGGKQNYIHDVPQIYAQQRIDYFVLKKLHFHSPPRNEMAKNR